MPPEASIEDLVEDLESDPFRIEKGFSTDMEECHADLFDPTLSPSEKASILAKWLSRWQPCLFGRSAALHGYMSYCVLTEIDIAKGDDHIRNVIAAHRRDWQDQATRGEKHGFIIIMISRAVAYAIPGEALQQLARRLCDLYLSIASFDEILLDTLPLSVERDEEIQHRLWSVGVNYFSSQGDKRWWHDHRIPGGMAFSMNSVGHMARSLAERVRKKKPELGAKMDALPEEKLIFWALPLAMRTIRTASTGAIPGTCLVDRGSIPGIDPEIPPYQERRNIFGDLVNYSENVYRGEYHTDYTIPMEYFDPSPDRPPGLARPDLYFTYLHDRTDEDYKAMGLGEEIEEVRKRMEDE